MSIATIVLDGGAIDVQFLVSKCHCRFPFDPDTDADPDPDLLPFCSRSLRQQEDGLTLAGAQTRVAVDR